MPAPSTLAASDVALDAVSDSVQRTYQRKPFFAMGRHWVFYVNDAGRLVFDSSVGATGVWYGPTDFVAQADGSEFSVFLQESPASSYVHLVRSDATGANPIYYHRGVLAADGTISWDAQDTAVAQMSGYEYENIGITMGYDDYIYIVYNQVEIADPNKCTPYVCQSITSDGTWTRGAGYPLQITAVEDASWVPLVSPYGTEVMVVYAAASGNIYSRVLAGGAWGAQVDSGFAIGTDAQKISIVSETVRSGVTLSARAVHVAFQAADWDLYSIRYESGAWQGAPANTIEVIGAFRQANPMLTILDTGDSDANHMPATLYCFWTPTTDAPTAEWVTYRVSRDLGDTWTNEAGADAAVELIDETIDGFEVQQSGSAYAYSGSDYDNGDFYIGLVYVVHRMPPALRHAGLIFADPDEDLIGAFVARHTATLNLGCEFIIRQPGPQGVSRDLPCELVIRRTATLNLGADFIVRNTTGTADLGGEFIARHSATLDLHGELDVRYSATLNLGGEFVVRHEATEDLYGEFFVNQAALDLYAYFEIGQGAEDLHGEFEIQQSATSDLYGEFGIRGTATADLFVVFFVRNAGTLDLPCEFVIRRSATLDLPCEFVIRGTITQDVPGEFVIRRSAARNLKVVFDVRHSASADLPAEFRIDKDYISKGLNVSVYRDMTIVG